MMSEQSERAKVASQIIGHLKASGGAVRGSQRKLAAKLGASKAWRSWSDRVGCH
jgi:hypothetical protein